MSSSRRFLSDSACASSYASSASLRLCPDTSMHTRQTTHTATSASAMIVQVVTSMPQSAVSLPKNSEGAAAYMCASLFFLRFRPFARLTFTPVRMRNITESTAAALAVRSPAFYRVFPHLAALFATVGRLARRRSYALFPRVFGRSGRSPFALRFAAFFRTFPRSAALPRARPRPSDVRLAAFFRVFAHEKSTAGGRALGFLGMFGQGAARVTSAFSSALRSAGTRKESRHLERALRRTSWVSRGESSRRTPSA